MPVNYRVVKKNGTLYGPTATGKYYQPNPVHNASAAPREDKTRWCITESDQFCVFEEADNANRETEEGLLGMDIRNGKLEVLGMEGEKIAFFPATRNSSDPWHGYPETMARIGDSFDSFFIDMLDNNEISKSICKKLLLKRI